MGTVYLAHHSETGTTAAVKVMSDALADQPEFRTRFAREIEILRRVQGPFVAGVLDGDAWAELPWVATEYVPGPDLARLVSEHGPLDEESWQGLAAGLVSALQRFEACRVVHRDLKPANVLLSADGPKVIDFGVAQLLEATALTSTGMAMGTVGWLAPEQIKGEQAGEASDVFAAGTILAFAGTGRPPFGAGTPAATLHAVLNEEPDLAGLPDPARQLVTGMMVKDPQQRWTVAQAGRYLSGADSPTVVDAMATRMWHQGDLTRLLAVPQGAAPGPAGADAGSPPEPTDAEPASSGPRGRRRLRSAAIAGGAAMALVASGLIGFALLPDGTQEPGADSSESSMAETGGGTEPTGDAANQSDRAQDAPLEETPESGTEQISCTWDSSMSDFKYFQTPDARSWPVSGQCGESRVDMLVQWQSAVGDGSGASNVTAAGTIDGEPAQLSLADLLKSQPTEDQYESGSWAESRTGTWRGSIGGDTLVAPWKESQNYAYLSDIPVSEANGYSSEVGTSTLATLGAASFSCFGPEKTSPQDPSGGPVTASWSSAGDIRASTTAGLCGFLTDGFAFPFLTD